MIIFHFQRLRLLHFSVPICCHIHHRSRDLTFALPVTLLEVVRHAMLYRCMRARLRKSGNGEISTNRRPPIFIVPRLASMRLVAWKFKAFDIKRNNASGSISISTFPSWRNVYTKGLTQAMQMIGCKDMTKIWAP
jgi:hypothetical protein